MNNEIVKTKTTESAVSHKAKKVVLQVFTMLCMAAMFAIPVFAAGTGEVNTTTFIEKVSTILKSVLILIGAGVGVWGVVNLLEGYGNDNPGAKSQGIKQLMAGLGVILVAVILVPVLIDMMKNAS